MSPRAAIAPKTHARNRSPHPGTRPGAVTIRDVAEAAQVSITTVSHVVNETRHVAAETRARVDQAIADLGYRPSSVARALKGDRTHTVGMIVTSSSNPFFASIIGGVEEACFARGYSLILCNAGDTRERLSSYLATLLEKRIDGLVVMTTNMDHSFFDELSASRPTPMVVIDTLNVDGATIVNDDSTAGGALAARFLLDRGLRRIAVFSGPKGHPRSQQRLDGFLAALAECGIDVNAIPIFETDLGVAAGHRTMQRLLAADSLPDAVFCMNDMIAIGALCAAAEARISIPHDLSVLGYDDIEMAAFTVPPLTTIRQPTREMGETAATALIDAIEGRGHEPDLIELAPELIVRQSVAAGPAYTDRGRP